MINKLFSLIIKYSSDGDILDSFTVLTQDNPYMFLSVSFTVLKTESIILSAVTGVSGSNGIGVSESSSTLCFSIYGNKYIFIYTCKQL